MYDGDDNRRPGCRLSIPEKLYGREDALGNMIDVFERVGGGEGCLLLVPGHSGVGKTALVQRLTVPIAKRNGLFCQGKFNQFQQGVPYLAIQQAMSDLLHQLLKEDERHQQEWRRKLLEAMGGLGQLLIDLAPRFEVIIGPQQPIANISPLEARHRFIGLLRSVLKVFCRPDNPLVLFLDDWQWADQASLDVLKNLGIGSDLRYFLVVAAYRDNEVPETHPFAMALRELQTGDTPVYTQPVRALTFDDVSRFVEDALQPSVENLVDLAQVIYARTQGNPFFLHAFLEYIHEAGMLHFHMGRQVWRWIGNKNAVDSLPDDVVSLFEKRFRQYGQECQKLLFKAASLGSVVKISHLCLVSGYERDACLALLDNVISKKILVVLNEGSWRQVGDQPASHLRFAHDRVQQAAYGLVDEHARPGELLEIGRVLLNTLEPESLFDHLFEVARYMNAGKHLLHDAGERVRLLALNAQAARKARSATAFRAALEFHRDGGELLKDPNANALAWSEQHDMTMALHLEWAETEFLEGSQSESEKLVHTALKHARTQIERAEAQRVLIVQYTLLARYPEAIAAGCSGLEALGIILPEADYEAMRDKELAIVREHIKGRDVAAYIDMPVMSQPEMRKATQLLISMGPPCYRAHQRLWSVLVPKAVNLILEHGNMPEVSYSHTALAGLLIWVGNEFALARQFADLSSALMERTFTSPSDRSVFYLMVGSSARHWFHHMNRSSQDYADAYEIGSRAGNLQYAAYAFGHDMYCCFFAGVSLQKLRKDTDISLDFSRTRHNQWAIDLLDGGRRIFDDLIDKDGKAAVDSVWEEDYLRRLDNHRNIQVACIYKVIRSFQEYVSGDYPRALLYSNQADEIIYTVGSQGLLPWPEHLLIRFLILASLYARQDENTLRIWDDEMRTIMDRLRTWARHCPDNYAFKLDLAEAEMALLQGRPGNALVLYERAIAAARKGGFLQWQGVANERAALILESQGLTLGAVVYWQQAYKCFEEWGAYGKVALMEQRFRERMLLAYPETSEGEFAAASRSIRDSLVSRKIELLRHQGQHEAEIIKRQTFERQAEELVQATARLREEVANRKRAEADLRKSEERYRLTMIAVRDGMWEWNMADGSIVWDKRSYEMLGYEQDAFKMDLQRWLELLHPDDRDVALASVHEQIAGTRRFTVEFRYRTADAAWLWIESRGMVVSFVADEPARLVGTHTDINDRKKAEASLVVATNEALTANHAKSIFLANMSHEIRTPLNGVIGMLQLMQTTRLDAEQQEYAEAALQSSWRLSRLLSDILDLSRVEAGRMTLKIARYEFKELADSIAQLFEPVASRKGLEFQVKTDASVPTELSGDMFRIQQVLSNLVGNAIKFTDFGHVKLETYCIPAVHGGVPRLLFIVSDTGIGIPEHVQDQLFEAFTQGEGDYKRQFQGAGLGLAITRELVNLMGGNVSLISDAGKGTEFYVVIPIAQEPSEAPVKASVEEKLSPSAMRILLAEDDEVSRRILVRVLEKKGHEVHAVENGEEVLESLRVNAFDVVIMDIQMPFMDGVDATKAIRNGLAGESARRIPIVAMTAYALEGDKETFMSAGMDGYISKPVDSSELELVLGKAFMRNG